MDHSYYRDRVSAWIDQELPPYEQEALSRHIAECQECQTLAEHLRRAGRLVDEHSSLGDSDYWENLAKKTEARIGINQSAEVTPIPGDSRKRFGTVWKIVSVAASLAVLTFIGIHREDIFEKQSPQETARIQAPSILNAPHEKPSGDSLTIGSAVTRESRESVSKQVEAPAEQADKKDADAELSTTPPTQSTKDESVSVGVEPAAIDVPDRVVPAPAPGVGAGSDESVTVQVKRESVTPTSVRDISLLSGIKAESLDQRGDISLNETIRIMAAPEAPANAATDPITSVKVRRLADLRVFRDSLLALYPLAEETGKGKSVRKTTPAAERPDSLLAECLFNIARATDDSTEFNSCVMHLETLFKESHLPFVGSYLESARELKK